MKVLIADDHPMLRDALARLLTRIQPSVQVLHAGDAADASSVLLQGLPDLAIFDLHMPGMERVEGVRRLHLRHPTLRLVVASGDDDPAVVRACLAAGAVGFLPKSEPPERLEQALRALLAGGSHVPALALADLQPGAPLPPAPDAGALTPRQLDVLRCLVRGAPNKLIARELGLTEGTVKIHVAAILRALHARNRTEAVVVARRLGLDG
jgi:DNA-binding NarL/FixJ family response regulator